MMLTLIGPHWWAKILPCPHFYSVLLQHCWLSLNLEHYPLLNLHCSLVVHEIATLIQQHFCHKFVMLLLKLKSHWPSPHPKGPTFLTSKACKGLHHPWIVDGVCWLRMCCIMLCRHLGMRKKFELIWRLYQPTYQGSPDLRGYELRDDDNGVP